jgi:hypothetical protein
MNAVSIRDRVGERNGLNRIERTRYGSAIIVAHGAILVSFRSTILGLSLFRLMFLIRKRHVLVYHAWLGSQQVTLRQLILIEVVSRFDHPVHSFRSAILIQAQTDSIKAVDLFRRVIQWHFVSY